MVLYTTEGCPRCKILKSRLKALNIPFEESQDISKLVAAGFKQAPILEKDNGELLTYKAALEYIKTV